MLHRYACLYLLKQNIRKFYGRHHDLVNRYGISVSKVSSDMFVCHHNSFRSPEFDSGSLHFVKLCVFTFIYLFIYLFIYDVRAKTMFGPSSLPFVLYRVHVWIMLFVCMHEYLGITRFLPLLRRFNPAEPMVGKSVIL